MNKFLTLLTLLFCIQAGAQIVGINGVNGQTITGLPTGSGPSAPQTLSGCGVQYVSGLTYTVGACQYSINSVIYNSPLTNITLATADPSNPRIDVIFVDSSQTVQKITGTPAVNPQQPTVNPVSQLALTFVLVPAGSSTPGNTTRTTIYHDGTGWTQTPHLNVNALSTNNPYPGTTYDVEFGSGGPAQSGSSSSTTSWILFTDPASGTVNLNSYNNLIFYILNKVAWPSSCVAQLQFYTSGGSPTSSNVVFTNGSYGFSTTNTSTYQQISIPVSALGATNANTTSELAIGFPTNISCSFSGFYLAEVSLQAGVVPPPPSTTIMNWKGTWNSTASYNPNDTLVSGGFAYVALSANTNVSVSTTATWQALALPLTLTTTGTSGAATYSAGTLNIPQYQGALTLTTTGTSGAATLIGNTINIPNYSGGAGSVAWGSITGTLSAQTDLQNALNLKAPLASPSFTGTPLAPTPISSDNSTTIATTAFVKSEGYAVYPSSGIPNSTGSSWGSSYNSGNTIPANFLSAIPLTGLATESANTVVGNGTGGSASPTALSMPSCSGGSNALIWTSGTGFGCNTISGGSSYANVIGSGSQTTIALINTACGTGTFYATTPLSIATGGTINCPVQFSKGGLWTIASGQNINFSKLVTETDAPSQHFAGSGTVSFQFSPNTPGINNTQVASVHWWGALPDNSTDATTAIQACINSAPQICQLESGNYVISSPLTDARTTQVSIIGASSSCLGGTLNCTTIKTSSASNDFIDVGTGSGVNTSYGMTFANFVLNRTTTPSGSSKGMSFTGVGNVVVSKVVSEDSIYPFYISGFSNINYGKFIDDIASWGYATGGYSSQVVAGFYIDTSNATGNPNASLYIEDSSAASNGLSGITSTGFLLSGNHDEDFFCTGCSTTNVSYGAQVIDAGGGGFHSYDIHFYNSIFDSSYVSCAKVSNASTGDTAAVEFLGGECSITGSGPGIDIESSQGVIVSGMEFASVGGNTSDAILANSSSNLIITQNQFNQDGGGNQGNSIVLTGTTLTTVSNNASFARGSGTPSNGVTLTSSSTNNTITGNTLDVGGIGVSFDGTSGNNQALGNTFGSLVSATVTDSAGTNTWNDNSGMHQSGGTNLMYRCTTAGLLPVGALTTNTANCTASTSTKIYVN